ncbi:MAG: hypothetical protein HC896_01705 [Bacteroidales bacterium]|nr:hypothetical protein [Bacteroidales bacterium]
MYLTDFVTPGANKLVVSLNFNDIYEPQWEVYLRLAIQGPSLTINTRDGFKPVAPITLAPNQPLMVSEEDLGIYFDYNNLVFQGQVSKAEMLADGRLPEGFYTFNIEVLDYRTSQVISNKATVATQISLAGAPMPIMPQDGSVVQPQEAQSITFSWQTDAYVNPLKTNFKINLYEIIEPGVNPKAAIANNQAVQIYESEFGRSNLFVYDVNMPLLEAGKQYIYIIEAQDEEGKSLFKNGGKSEPTFFYYGYPEGGTIALEWPDNDHAFTLREDKKFRWKEADNMLDNQSYRYQLKIVELDSAQTPADAMEENEAHYFFESNVFQFRSNYETFTRNVHYATGKKYAWQVKAMTGEQEIATSQVYVFHGPPCLEVFKAGNYNVYVTKTTGCDPNDLTGEGEVYLYADGTRTPVYYNNIGIKAQGGEYFITHGTVYAVLDSGLRYELDPEYARNQKAWFYADSLRLTREHFQIHGYVQWDFPHVAKTDDVPRIYSKPTWLGYEDWSVLGKAYFAKDTRFDLLDPHGFNIYFNETSFFYIRGAQKYFMEFNGNLTLPEKVKNKDGGLVILPFGAHEQIFYIAENEYATRSNMFLVQNLTAWLNPVDYTIDLSDQESPGLFAGNKEWRGLYLNKNTLSFAKDFDKSAQQFLEQDYDLTVAPGNGNQMYVNNQGLQFTLHSNMGTEPLSWFNTFPSKIDSFNLTIENSWFIYGTVKGTIKIPFISQEKDFNYVLPMSVLGLQTGYLAEDLAEQQFCFNKGNTEQEVLVKINRGVFADKERIDLNIDLTWPYIEAEMKAVEGVRLWGNYGAGFYVPNGSINLTSRAQGMVKGYQITLHTLGCGRNGNIYSFGVSGDMVMGDDIAGANGPPQVNFYTLQENKLLTGTAVAMPRNTFGNDLSAIQRNTEYSEGQVGVSTGEAEDKTAAFAAEFDKYQANISARTNALNSITPMRP